MERVQILFARLIAGVIVAAIGLTVVVTVLSVLFVGFWWMIHYLAVFLEWLAPLVMGLMPPGI